MDFKFVRKLGGEMRPCLGQHLYTPSPHLLLMMTPAGIVNAQQTRSCFPIAPQATKETRPPLQILQDTMTFCSRRPANCGDPQSVVVQQPKKPWNSGPKIPDTKTEGMKYFATARGEFSSASTATAVYSVEKRRRELILFRKCPGANSRAVLNQD
jgi:hypothetical protein